MEDFAYFECRSGHRMYSGVGSNVEILDKESMHSTPLKSSPDAGVAYQD